MFPGVFRRNPDGFKLLLEYGKDSLADQAAAGGQVRLTVALATLEFEFNSDESEANVLERFTQAKSKIAFDRLEERVVLKVAERDQGHGVRIRLSTACITPALRSLQVLRTSGTGSVPEALLTALFKHCDLSGVWKLRGAEGFGNFWCSCCEVRSWRSLANMNLSSCGLTSLPPALSSLATLRILRLSYNKLTALPPEVSALTALEVLQADHNQLTALPAELRRCSSLRHLELEENRLVTPVLDLRALSNLVSLQLYGNPLEYLPELSPALALRSLSLANVRIMADKDYSRWEVEVAAQSYYLTQSYRSHKLAPLFKLTFRRSSCQHPLLAGALGRISEERANCELMSREETAIQQLVLMALSEQPVVAEQACRTLGALAQLGLATARKLLAHDVLSTIVTLLRSPRRAGKLCGLNLLGSMAAASEAVSSELFTLELLHLLQACIQADDRELRVAALTALAALAFARDNKLKIRAAKDLLAALMQLATEPTAGSDPAGLTPARASPKAAAAVEAAAPGGARGRGQPTDGPTGGAAGPRPAAAPQPSTMDEAPAVVRMPSRAGGGGGAGATATSQRRSDTGAGGVLASLWVGSPPGPASGGLSASVGGGAPTPSTPTAAGSGSLSVGGAPGPGPGPQFISSHRVSGGHLTAEADVLSPPQQAARPLHHSNSFPNGVGTTAGGAGGATGGSASASGGAPLSPTAAGPLSPTTPTAAEQAATAGPAAASAASASGLPPQIAMAPPRAVPEPVARRDQARLLAIKVLGILGENDVVRRALGQAPITGRGVRVLALDGGGMRGLALVQIMRQIERRTRRPLHELFDLIVGTSTGAIVAFGLGVFHFSLDQCESIYRGLGHKVFNQSNATGPTAREELLAAQAQAQAAAQAAAASAAAGGGASASSTGSWRESLFRVMRGTSTNLRVAVYGFKHDATTFEELLRQLCDVKKLGCVGNQLIDAGALGGPKVAAVATQVSVCPVTPFLFTSYELPPEVAPAAAAMHACPSSSRYQLWQAVRASSAAPYYFDDFVCGDDRYQDGAATANNPSILALQQARLLWPGVQLDALVSLGCGAAPSVRRERGAHAVLDTGAVLVDAATSPDRADEALSTLLPLVPGVRYFRFQPVHERCAMELDDVDSQHWAALQAAVDEYCTAHTARLDELAELLLSGQDDGDAAGLGPDGGKQTAGDAGGGGPEAEMEEPFEVPPGVGPDGGPLRPVPRVRLGCRRGIVILEAPRPTSHPTATGGGCLAGLDADQLVIEALARRPQALRRCDLAATAADAALSAALVAAHVRHLDEQQRQLAAAQQDARRGSSDTVEVPAAAPVTTAAVVAAEATVPQRDTLSVAGALVSGGNLAAAAASAAGGGLLSPPRVPPGSQVPRVPGGGGGRHWLSGGSGRGVVSVGGWPLPALEGTSGGNQLEVAGEVVAAEEAAAAAAAMAAAAAAAATARVVPVAQPVAAEAAVAAPPPQSSSPSMASAAEEAAAVAAAGADAAVVASTASADPIGGDAASGGSTTATSAAAAASASANTSTSTSPSTASLLYDFLFVGKRGTSARAMTVGGTPGHGTTATGAAAPAPAAATTSATAAASAAAPAPATSATAATQPGHSGASPASPAAGTPPACTEGGGPSSLPHRLQGTATNEAAAGTAPPAGDQDLGDAAMAAAGGAPSAQPGAADAAADASPVGFTAPEVQPALLLAALLQDLQGRCGLLHLGLRVVQPRGAAAAAAREQEAAARLDKKVEVEDEGCGLVASWRQEVVAVVEPGPDADRILTELGHNDAVSAAAAGGGGGGGNPRGHPSLASLFSAAQGAPLESPGCCSYRLLARQEVWHNGLPLATLLLQVTRPASLLRPSDLIWMAPQLSGLVVTSVTPLPPAIITALLHAGAAAVLCCSDAPPAQRPPSAAPAGRPPTPVLVPAAAAALSLPRLVSPDAGGDSGGGQRPSTQQQSSQVFSQAHSGTGAVATAVKAGNGQEGSTAAVVGFFEVLVGELLEGATVLSALTAAEGQNRALQGHVIFHHL